MFAQKLGLAVCLVWPLAAGPTLTTIQDVIYTAGGTPYNGIAMVTWTPFEAGDTSKIATQSVTVSIIGGNLTVLLVPTTNATPAGYYSVTYTSAGNDQFTEAWVVPPSTVPLRVRDVLQVTLVPPSGLTNGSTPIPETSVTGLTADLAVRPVQGPNYATARVAVIDASGAIEGASGDVSDCLHVDGSSGPCGIAGGGAGPAFSDGEVLAGVVNGANVSFKISGTPAPAASVALYRNGILQKVGQDFTLAGNAITFASAATPQQGDTLLANYRVTPAGAPQGPPAPQVLCSGIGSATSSTTNTTLGTCTIPAGTLQSGDRVKISFDYSHEGALTGFSFRVNWGNTMVAQRSAASNETFVSGWAEAGAGAAASQLTVESWGTVLGLAAGVLNGWDSLNFPIAVAFQANMAAITADTVTLRNFTVVRYPKAP